MLPSTATTIYTLERAIEKRNNELKGQNNRRGRACVRGQTATEHFLLNRDASNLFCAEICQFWVWAKDGLAHKEVLYWEKEKLEKLLTLIQCYCNNWEMTRTLRIQLDIPHGTFIFFQEEIVTHQTFNKKPRQGTSEERKFKGRQSFNRPAIQLWSNTLPN